MYLINFLFLINKLTVDDQVLKDIPGVFVKVFFRYDEDFDHDKTPLQRFYRYVLKSSLSFKPNGSRLAHGANFAKIPVDPLLTLGMDGKQ